jgi:hypothetical protein
MKAKTIQYAGKEFRVPADYVKLGYTHGVFGTHGAGRLQHEEGSMMAAAAGLLADQELEERIEQQRSLICSAPTRRERFAAWNEFKRLVNSRSPQQVERMEREMRLA